MVSNAVDMANWMKLQVDGGHLNGIQVIPESVITDTHTAFNVWEGTALTNALMKPPYPVSYSNTGYGLGFEIGQYRGKSRW